MIVLGIILLVIGLLIHSTVLFWLGVVLALIGALLNFAPGPWAGTGGTRRRYW